jgi:hypothetical protein
LLESEDERQSVNRRARPAAQSISEMKTMSKRESARDAGAALAAPPMTARPIVYSKPVTLELPQPYTLPPRVAARRHAQILHSCVVNGRRKPE